MSAESGHGSLDVISGAAILDQRKRRRKWRHPRPGVGLWVPNEAEVQDDNPSPYGRHVGWPLFRFLCVLCNFRRTGSGNEVIQDGDRKRKGRQLAPQPHCGLKYAPYTTWPSLLTHISVTVYVSLHLSEVKDVPKCSCTWRTRLCPVPIKHLTKIWQKCFNDWLFPFSLDCYSKDDNRAKRAAAPPGPSPGRWGPPGMGYLPKDDNRAKRSMQKP